MLAGQGYYQEWGKEAKELHPGDVVAIPAEVKHWHGAAADSWFVHQAVEVLVRKPEMSGVSRYPTKNMKN